MNGWLLDTNVVSELRKTHPDDRVKAWSDAQPSDGLFLSSVTLAEIRFGIERQADPIFRQDPRNLARPEAETLVCGAHPSGGLGSDPGMAAYGRVAQRQAHHFQPAGPFHRCHGASAFPDTLYP